MRPALLAVVALALSALPAQAQDDRPSVSVRPFFVVSGERFTANQTFETVFNQPVQPMWGGGAQVAFRNGFFVDVTVSRFAKTGERAFFFENQGFRLGTPVKVTLTPIEVSAGGRVRATPRVFPYFGGGFGTYAYRESGDEPTDAFERRHIGYLGVGGVELRVGRSAAIAFDAQYTTVRSIIGAGGLSLDVGENDLGGIAARFRVIVGR